MTWTLQLSNTGLSLTGSVSFTVLPTRSLVASTQCYFYRGEIRLNVWPLTFERVGGFWLRYLVLDCNQKYKVVLLCPYFKVLCPWAWYVVHKSTMLNNLLILMENLWKLCVLRNNLPRCIIKILCKNIVKLFVCRNKYKK